MADRAHSTSRRALLAGLSATPLVSLPVAAMTPDPDARITARVAELFALAACLEERTIEKDRLYEAAWDAAGPRAPILLRQDEASPWMRAFDAARAGNGYRAAYDAFNEADRRVHVAIAALAPMRPTSLRGLIAKVRVLELDPEFLPHVLLDLKALDARLIGAA